MDKIHNFLIGNDFSMLRLKHLNISNLDLLAVTQSEYKNGQKAGIFKTSINSYSNGFKGLDKWK